MSGLAGLSANLLVRFEWAVLVYFAIINAWQLILLAGATREMRRRVALSIGHAQARLPESPLAPSISLLLPLRSPDDAAERLSPLLGLRYPDFEVVAVTESESTTLEALRERLGLVPVHPVYRRTLSTAPVHGLFRSSLFPNLVVVVKAAADFADALNAAANVARGTLLCVVPPSAHLEPESMRRLVRPFLERDDVLVAGASLRVANDAIRRAGRVVDARVPRHPLAGLQAVESLRDLSAARLGWNPLGGSLAFAGALALYPRRILLEAGGYGRDANDVDLVLRLRRRGYETGGPHRVAFVPDTVGWASAPTDTTTIGEERENRHGSMAQALWRHRAIGLNRRYGTLGLVAFPIVFALELLAPVVELTGLLGLALGLALGVFDAAFVGAALLILYGLGASVTVFMLVMDELCFEHRARLGDRLRLAALALLEPLGYRQLTTFWKLQGLEKAIRGAAPAAPYVAGDATPAAPADARLSA